MKLGMVHCELDERICHPVGPAPASQIVQPFDASKKA